MEKFLRIQIVVNLQQKIELLWLQAAVARAT